MRLPCPADAVLQRQDCRSQLAHLLQARESGWCDQVGRIIQSEEPFRELDGLGRQRKIGLCRKFCSGGREGAVAHGCGGD